ncbi:cellulose binding domain-containing protein [Butyrivibrio sp. JL13D10]|uniref:cellulose binding domain-containing protein n=1 Tax=Butyrivibrio sp. JL13D10 TaxID=3236815 RepID=UPI0038B4BB2D
MASREQWNNVSTGCIENYVITPDDWNASIRPGESAFFGVQGSGSIGSLYYTGFCILLKFQCTAENETTLKLRYF